ncbi:MAG: signal peptidase I [Candidatus Peregrinibacteria bacterium Gr01-1014_25]|nr:MAG: signal peptidase I [Candidatus Peregrinibacteria bacterium Gr01-1014_25]
MDGMIFRMRQRPTGLLLQALDVFLNIVVIVAVIVGVRTFLVSPFQVEGSSMTSTLEDGEYIIINKLEYYLREPKRGDIVVFTPPHEQQRKYYVKRVIGLPGDDVVLRDGYVFLREAGSQNLKRLDEGYLDDTNRGKTFASPHGGGDRTVSYTIPGGHYFVLGDNRQGSLDSRSFATDRNQSLPFVPERNIKGKVWLVALPVSKIHALAPPEYGL